MIVDNKRVLKSTYFRLFIFDVQNARACKPYIIVILLTKVLYPVHMKRQNQIWNALLVEIAISVNTYFRINAHLSIQSQTICICWFKSK